MRVIQLPEGVGTRSLSMLIDGERITVDFKLDGTASVSNEKAEKLCAALPALTLVGDKKAKEPDLSPDEIEEEE